MPGRDIFIIKITNGSKITSARRQKAKSLSFYYETAILTASFRMDDDACFGEETDI